MEGIVKKIEKECVDIDCGKNGTIKYGIGYFEFVPAINDKVKMVTVGKDTDWKFVKI